MQMVGMIVVVGVGVKLVELNLFIVNFMNVVQFKVVGGNFVWQIIFDEFCCYVKWKGDGFSLDLIVQVLLGGIYCMVYGNGIYQINKDRKIMWQGGFLNKVDGFLDFDDYGQVFSLLDVSEDIQDILLNFECYQCGFWENVVLYNFKFRMFKLGLYLCVLVDGQGDRGVLEVGVDNIYRFGGVVGCYCVDYCSD